MVFGFAIWTGRYFDVHGATLLAWSGTVLATIAVMGIARELVHPRRSG